MEETNFENNNNEPLASNNGLDQLNDLLERGFTFPIHGPFVLCTMNISVIGAV